jgi:uncharacterized protein (TIGR04255 family)
MNDTEFKFLKAPIIEAVLDIDCDMPPGFDVAALEKPAFVHLKPEYPKARTQFIQTQKFEIASDQAPRVSVQRAIQGMHFLHQDEKQLVQFRTQGFSFNRLAPYTSLDDYLPEIQRTWKLFVEIAIPAQIRAVRLRYINRILLPMPDDKLQLEDYLKVGPRLPDEQKLTFTGFLNQHTAVESETGHQVNIVLTTQMPEKNLLPLIFDITVESLSTAEVENWAWLLAKIQALRGLKNRVFRNTLTERCLNLFQQP